MDQSNADQRSPSRRSLDEQIAAEPRSALPALSPQAIPLPVESHLKQHQRRPIAVTGIVENGIIRVLDPQVKLPEHSRVIIVTSE